MESCKGQFKSSKKRQRFSYREKHTDATEATYADESIMLEVLVERNDFFVAEESACIAPELKDMGYSKPLPFLG